MWECGPCYQILQSIVTSYSQFIHCFVNMLFCQVFFSFFFSTIDSFIIFLYLFLFYIIFPFNHKDKQKKNSKIRSLLGLFFFFYLGRGALLLDSIVTSYSQFIYRLEHILLIYFFYLFSTNDFLRYFFANVFSNTFGGFFFKIIF